MKYPYNATRFFFSLSKTQKMAFVLCVSLGMISFHTSAEKTVVSKSSLSFLEKSILKSPNRLESSSFLPSLKQENPLFEPRKVNSNTIDFDLPALSYEKSTLSFLDKEDPILEIQDQNLGMAESSKVDLLETTIAQESPTPNSLEEEVWCISYIPWQGESSAPLDGSIGLWADGWLIAHRHMPNGQKIASFVQRIELDGQLYILDDVWIATDEITEEEVARIRANNGITLQTCIDDFTNYMVHYCPAPGFTGYSYCFSQYPYTIHDTLAIGYDPSQIPKEQDLFEPMSDVSLETDSSSNAQNDFSLVLKPGESSEPFTIQENPLPGNFSFL